MSINKIKLIRNGLHLASKSRQPGTDTINWPWNKRWWIYMKRWSNQCSCRSFLARASKETLTILLFIWTLRKKKLEFILTSLILSMNGKWIRRLVKSLRPSIHLICQKKFLSNPKYLLLNLRNRRRKRRMRKQKSQKPKQKMKSKKQMIPKKVNQDHWLLQTGPP